jgi:glyoxylase-like metal-dependent hydrolase (beta-lactamase superfamily II)
MPDWKRFTTGLHRVSDRCYAYMQPPGNWGLNNTAFFVNGGETLMMDTGCDIPLTDRMLDAIAAVEPAAARVGTVVLTHWHVDHVHGVSAPRLRGSRIHASRICADWMANLPPKRWLEAIGSLEGDAKRQIEHLLGNKFDFSGLEYIPPTDIFEGATQLHIGGAKVEVVEGKPCHTRSDSLVRIASEGVVHVGDLISAGRHVGLQFPFMRNLLELVDLMLSWDAQTYIPGHGPLLDLQDVRDIKTYLQFMQAQARRRYDAGMPVEAATEDILRDLGPYKSLRGAENLFFTIKMLYCEFAGDTADHVRRDYPGYLATQWALRKSVPQKFPELFAQF